MKAFNKISISKLLIYFDLEVISRSKYYIEYNNYFFCLIGSEEKLFDHYFKEVSKAALFNSLIEFDEQLTTSIIKEELMLCEEVESEALLKGLTKLNNVSELIRVILKISAKDSSKVLDIYIRKGNKSILIHSEGKLINIIEFNDSVYHSLLKNDYNHLSLSLTDKAYLTLAPISIVYEDNISQIGEVIFFSNLTTKEKINILNNEYQNEYVDCYFNNNKDYNLNLLDILLFRLGFLPSLNITLASNKLNKITIELLITNDKKLTEKLKQSILNTCNSFFILNEKINYDYISKSKIELFTFSFPFNSGFIIELLENLFSILNVTGYNFYHLKNGIVPYENKLLKLEDSLIDEEEIKIDDPIQKKAFEALLNLKEETKTKETKSKDSQSLESSENNINPQNDDVLANGIDPEEDINKIF